MRYIFISDVHGEYQKMIDALKSVKFNPQIDTLVSLGDLFDRGPQSKEVLEYVMSCPNRILVAGNHELRFKQLLLGQDFINRYDRSNGIDATLTSFCNGLKASPYILMTTFRSSETFNATRRLFWRYMDELVYALEWSDLIATHGWLPTDTAINSEGKSINVYRPTWRAAAKNDWYEATWSHSGNCLANKLFPDKTLIVGHWHVNRFRDQLANRPSNYAATDDYTTLKVGNKMIGIDGCANLSYGRVNAYVYESDEVPIEYR